MNIIWLLKSKTINAVSLKLVLILMLGMITACTSTTSEEYLKQARENIDKKEIQTAIINLKNALQQNPKNGQARFLLGETYIKVGDGAGAEKELEAARSLNTSAALLSSELKNTQSRAFYEGIYYKLQFWPTLDRYRVYKQTELIDDIILKGVDLFNTNFTDNNLYFYPNGVPSMGGTITLKNKRGKVLYVIMTPVTARVRISPEPPENW